MTTSMVFWTGALLIFIYALERFNTPPTNRSSTTWIRYHVAALVYVGFFEITFAVITHYPSLFGYLEGIAPTLKADLENLSNTGDDIESTTVGIALVLSVLVPKIPGLARVDRSLRFTLQRAAAIPHEARRFAKSIKTARFKPGKDLSDAIEAHYASRGLTGIIPADNSRATARKIHQLTAMMLRMEHWDKDRRFAGFLQERQEQRARLQERYNRIMEMAKGYFQLPDQETRSADDGPLNDVTLKFRIGFRDELNDLVLEAAELASHTLLRCCVRSTPRFTEVHAMGLRPNGGEHPPGMSPDQIMLLLGALVSVLLLYSILVSNPQQMDSLSRIAMVPIIYTVAVICAVIPKQNWVFFQREPGEPPPALGYTISGLAAIFFALCVAILFRVLLETKGIGLSEAIVEAWNDFRDNSIPWLLMSFVTCVATAAVIDSTHVAAVDPEPRRRWLEAGVLAAALSLSGALVWWLLQGVREPGDIPPLLRILGISAVIGGVIGYMVPHWCRGSPRGKRVEEPETDRNQSNYEPTA